MKRAAALILILLLTFAGCAPQASAVIALPSAQPTAQPTPQPISYKGTVGLLLNRETPYTDELIKQLLVECEVYSYRLMVEYANGDCDKQLEQAVAMLLEYAAVLAIEPVDVDKTAELADTVYECGGKLINIITPYSGKADVLVSPDYTAMGAAAGQHINSLMPEESEEAPQVLALMGGVEDFVMQLIYDGLSQETDNLSARFCSCDAQLAYTKTAKAIAEGGVDAVFSQTAEMGVAAARAIEEAGADIPVVTLGLDADVAALIESGGISAALYTAPERLSERLIHYYKMFIIDGEYTSAAFDPLAVYTATQENIYRAFETGASYGQPFA